MRLHFRHHQQHHHHHYLNNLPYLSSGLQSFSPCFLHSPLRLSPSSPPPTVLHCLHHRHHHHHHHHQLFTELSFSLLLHSDTSVFILVDASKSWNVREDHLSLTFSLFSFFFFPSLSLLTRVSKLGHCGRHCYCQLQSFSFRKRKTQPVHQERTSVHLQSS